MYLIKELNNIAKSIIKYQNHTLEVAIIAGGSYLFLEGIITLQSALCSFDIYCMNVMEMTEKLPHILEFTSIYHITYNKFKNSTKIKQHKPIEQEIIEIEYQQINLSN